MFFLYYPSVFLLGIQDYFYWFDASLLIFSLISLYKNKEDFFCIGKKIFILVRSNKILSFLVIFIFSYLFSQVVLLPPYNWDSMTYNLARVSNDAGSG